MPRFPGGKNLEGAYQRIINQIPPHTLYIELFAGSAAIRRIMRPSATSILIDSDPQVVADLRGTAPPLTTVLEDCGIAWFRRMHRQLGTQAVVYADPPYLQNVCLSRLRYRHVLSEAQHEAFLKLAVRTEARVIISGYRSLLYDRLLSSAAGWRRIVFQQISRGGKMMEECLWLNFPEPIELHDYAWLGDDYRQRENIRRMQKRWRLKLARMDRLQRQALLSVLEAAHLAEIGGVSSRSTTGGNGGAVLTAGNGDSGHRQKRR